MFKYIYIKGELNNNIRRKNHVKTQKLDKSQLQVRINYGGKMNFTREQPNLLKLIL